MGQAPGGALSPVMLAFQRDEQGWGSRWTSSGVQPRCSAHAATAIRGRSPAPERRAAGQGIRQSQTCASSASCSGSGRFPASL